MSGQQNGVCLRWFSADSPDKNRAATQGELCGGFILPASRCCTLAISIGRFSAERQVRPPEKTGLPPPPPVVTVTAQPKKQANPLRRSPPPPDFYRYILDCPNAKPANVENIFYWENVKVDAEPILRIVHALTMHGDKPGHPPYVIVEKQIYCSHYSETAMELTYLLRGSDDPKQSGFYLVRTIGSEQALLTDFKGGIIRKIEVKDVVSDMEKSLTSTKDVLEHPK